jgi:hypothetical protein
MKIEDGIPINPEVTWYEGRIIPSPVYLDACAETLAQIFWIARTCTNPLEVPSIENALWVETKTYGTEQLSPAATRLSQPKVESQRWVFKGVYDHSLLGPFELRTRVEPWKTDIIVRALSGDQRHRLVNSCLMLQGRAGCLGTMWSMTPYKISVCVSCMKISTVRRAGASGEATGAAVTRCTGIMERLCS